MSDVQSTPAAIAVPAEDTVPTPAAETAPVVAAPVEEPAVAAATTTEEPVVASEAAPVAAAVAATEEPKPVEPVNEGLLGYKAPGLLKQFTFAKKDFWFSDEPVSPAHLDLYLRGEKAEISHPVVAWASQTGKGLLFFVKKGESDKTHPAGVLPLYEAVDLKKSSPHEFTFKLHNHQHTFKATTDAERDGWFHSIEKSIELGKATKENIHESEGYKAELAKLSGPVHVSPAGATTALTAATAAAAVSATPKKSTEIDNAAATKPAGSDDEDELKKKTKSRSTSRGVLARLRGKKEELEAKVEEKKEEHEAKQEEKKEEKAAEKAAKEEEKKDETAEAVAVGGATGAVVAAEEKPKASKRGSIFGSLKAGFKSPIKEKEQKDAELKAEEGAVSETAPQLPETAVVAPEIAEPVAATETAEPVAATEPVKEAEIITPAREKKNFLSGMPFLNKRDRSVSPSAVKETPAPVAAPAAEVTEPAIDQSSLVPGSHPAAAAALADGAEPEEKIEEPAPINKRQSVLGGLGRRASKMMQRVQSSNKKETASPIETKAEESAATPAVAEDDLAAHEATEPVVENKPESVATPAAPVVTASA